MCPRGCGGTSLATGERMPLRENKLKRRPKKGVRNRRRRDPRQRYFLPDRSSCSAEVDDCPICRLFAQGCRPATPSGRLLDGRPYAALTVIEDPWCIDHYWIDSAGLETASVQELGALVRRSVDEWPGWVDPAELEVSAVACLDDQQRPIWDIQVRFPLVSAGDEDLGDEPFGRLLQTDMTLFD